MDYKQLSDTELLIELEMAVKDETNAELRVLHLLAEVERRHLYSKDHPSLFQFCVEQLKLSSGSTQRKIDTMRMLKICRKWKKKFEMAV